MVAATSHATLRRRRFVEDTEDFRHAWCIAVSH
jgi:hypothetical protein